MEVTAKVAEPSVERLERFYALINDLADRVAVAGREEDEAEEWDPGPVTAKQTADEQEAQRGSPEAPLVLDPAELCREVFARGRFRELARIVCVKEDGSDLTTEEAGAVAPSAVRAACPFFMIELGLVLTMFSGGGIEEASLPDAGAAPSA